MSGFMPYSRQEISDADVAAVAEALRASHLTQGPLVERFEADLARFVGARFAVVFNSGTAALHAAYAAAGIGPGTSVLTTPITFVATANASLYLGGSVRFADVEPDSAQMDPDAADDQSDKSIKVLAPVHFGGEVAGIEALAAVAEARHWTIVEDASHALGATYRTSDGVEHQVGACDHSAICCFSFHAVKQITTGEGGAATTNDEALYRRMKRFRTHGITRDASELTANDGPWYYEQHELGYNYRLTDVQCALGRSQLARYPGWLAARRQVAAWYEERFASVADIEPLRRPQWSRGAHHLFVLRVPPTRRRAIYDELLRRGIGANVHYIPVYHQPFYQRGGFPKTVRPGAEEYYRSALTIPLFPAMTEDQVDQVVAGVVAGLGGRAG
ncbi:MAG: UDP-4-amino-4,6-dideoxy-N-acetyl-beta-L-altrosamine transaminase [Gemmatimonadetes bacterium]|nr:UDP-4-amino-4,6-dideoxy-N-acetyl-beta-L-altrosamine transaminase [Gemmatimonadota bacterium]